MLFMKRTTKIADYSNCMELAIFFSLSDSLRRDCLGGGGVLETNALLDFRMSALLEDTVLIVSFDGISEDSPVGRLLMLEDLGRLILSGFLCFLCSCRSGCETSTWTGSSVFPPGSAASVLFPLLGRLGCTFYFLQFLQARR